MRITHPWGKRKVIPLMVVITGQGKAKVQAVELILKNFMPEPLGLPHTLLKNSSGLGS